MVNLLNKTPSVISEKKMIKYCFKGTIRPPQHTTKPWINKTYSTEIVLNTLILRCFVFKKYQ